MSTRITAAQIHEAIVNLGAAFHDLNVNVEEMRTKLDARANRDEEFRLSLFRMIDGLSRRIQEMQERIDAQFDQAWREIDDLATQVRSMSATNHARYDELESRIRQLELRIANLERRVENQNHVPSYPMDAHPGVLPEPPQA